MPDFLASYSRRFGQQPSPTAGSYLDESVRRTNPLVHQSTISRISPSVVPASLSEAESGGRREHWKRMEDFSRGRRKSQVAAHSILDENREERAEKRRVAV